MTARAVIAVAILATLPGEMESCDAARPCQGDALVQRFLRDDDLCGDAPTAVKCVRACPTLTGFFIRPREELREQAWFYTESNEGSTGQRLPLDRWLMDLKGDSRIRFFQVPASHGVPVTLPRPELRSSRVPLVADSTRMSAYMQVADRRQGCILSMDVAWAWTLTTRSGPFAEDWEAAFKVTAREGTCPPPSPGFPDVGEAWKIGGQLLRPG